jgi:adenylate cyclase
MNLRVKNFFLNKSLLSFAFLFLVLFILRAINPHYIQSITNLSLDSYQKIFKYQVKDSPVIIVDVDEQSLGKLGQFPWNRKIFGDLVNILNEAQTSVIAFDIFFSENDKQNPNEILKAYGLDPDSDTGRQILKLKNSDDYFLKEISSANVVLPILGLVQQPVNLNKQKSLTNFIIRGQDPKSLIYTFDYNLTSLKKINDQAKGIGHISIIKDTDAILRKVPLLLNIQDHVFPSLAIESLRLYQKQENILIESNVNGIEQLKLRPFSIQTDPNAMFWIKYKTPLKTQYISVVDILENKINPNVFKNKIVLVGSSAQGLFDFVKTPSGVIMPGVEVHANIIENIITNNILKRSYHSFFFEFVILIFGMIFAFFFSDKAKPKFSILAYLVLVFLTFISGLIIYQNNILIDVSYPIFSITFMFLTGLYLRYLRENELALILEKKQMLLKQEREIAGEVQKKLFPELDEHEQRIYAINIPARDVSGDYYDIVKVNDDEFYFTLADVSGKGIKAGILMASASAVFKALAKTGNSLSNIAMRMNNQVNQSSYQGMFITAVLGKVNFAKSQIEYINHGHEPIMIVDLNNTFKYLPSNLPPLGIMEMEEESFFETQTISLKGNSLYVYTDGVTEGYQSDKSELTVKGLERIVHNHHKQNIKTVIKKIAQTLQSDYLRDDITILGIQL